MTARKISYNSPSVDRIDPKKGYVYSNIRIVCFSLNAAIGNWGDEKTLEVMRTWIARVDAAKS